MPAPGPLTSADLKALWEATTDPGYVLPIETAGFDHGLEAYQMLFDTLARASAAVDASTQGLYVLPWSGQTNLPASGPQFATVSLQISRSPGASLVLATGTRFGEVSIDPSTELAVGGDIDADGDLDPLSESLPIGSPILRPGTPFFSGRYFLLQSDVGFAPNEASRTVSVIAENPGWGYNNPASGTITTVDQPGAGRTNSNASVVVDSSKVKVVALNVADTFSPQHVGQHVTFLAGANAGRTARAVGYEPPNLEVVPNTGGALILEQYFTLITPTVSGTFVDGEPVTQANSGTTARGTLKRGATNSAGQFVLVIAPTTPLDVFGLVNPIVGSSSGASATTSGGSFLESPNLVAATGTETWQIVDWEDGFGISSTNAASPSGGRAGQLDEVGRERDVLRATNEPDSQYRLRVHQIADSISPNAIRRAVNRILSPGGQKGCLREPGSVFFPGLYLDLDAFDYNFTIRPQDRYKLLLDFIDYRGWFQVTVPPTDDGEFGFFFDVGNYGFYDAAPFPDYWNGYPVTTVSRLKAIWNAVEAARAGGTGWRLAIDGQGCP